MNYYPQQDMLVDRVCFQHLKSQRFWGEWTVQELRKKFQRQRGNPFQALSANRSRRYINEYDLDRKLYNFENTQHICKTFKVNRRQRANSYDKQLVSHRASTLSNRSFQSARHLVEVDHLIGSHYDLNAILVCLCVMSTSSQQEKAAFLVELLPDEDNINIDEHVVQLIIEPLVTLCMHVIPALVLKIMREPDVDSSQILCYGGRNIGVKKPSFEVFRAFVNRLAKIDRRISHLMAEQLQGIKSDSALYSRIQISKEELTIKLTRMARLFEVWNIARSEQQQMIELQSEVNSAHNPLNTSIKLDSWRDNRSMGDILHGLD